MISAATFRARQTEAVIVIRMLPPEEVSPNWYGKWRKKAKAIKAFRAEAYKATRYESTGTEAFDGSSAPVVLDAEIAWCCGRKSVDPSNAPILLKAAIDGISDVLWGGQDRHVTIGEVRQIRGEGLITVRLKGAG